MDALAKKLYLISSLRTGYILNENHELVTQGYWLNPFKRKENSAIVYTVNYVKNTIEECLEQLSKGKTLGLLGGLKHARTGVHNLKTTLANHKEYVMQITRMLMRIDNFVTRFENELLAKMDFLLKPNAEYSFTGILIRQTPMPSPVSCASPATPLSIAGTPQKTPQRTPPRTPPSSPRSISRKSLLLDRTPSEDNGIALILRKVITGK